MSATKNAVPLGSELTEPCDPIPVTCHGCGWRGDVNDLLTDPDDPNPQATLWCPQCHTSGWTFD